ncbi:MAG TPA: IclR family transcriptional regulator C-terminal domain-containing protein [Gaiellaceae bacterium]|nr:IclR family transcriptional regulator C-terminal domain-containing protein [Gaiellaceae bacterium]
MSPTGGTTMKPRVPTVHRIGQLLSVFTVARPAWRLHELARALDWDMATTHRLAKALVDISVLDFDDDGVYRIGLLPVELAAISVSGDPRRRELLRRIEEIGEESRLTTQIGVLERDAVAIVASHESHSALRAAAMLGERLPLHATAVGKAILTQLDLAQVRRLLPARLPSFAARTITDRSELLEEVAKAREEGIAYADSELSDGLYAMAIPIPGRYGGTQPAGLTCAGISRDLAPEQWSVAERALRKQAAEFRRSADGPVATTAPGTSSPTDGGRTDRS